MGINPASQQTGGTTLNSMEVRQRGTIIDIDFPDSRIQVRATRIREDNDNARAEVQIWADLPIGDRYRNVRLVRDRLNMLAINEKNSLLMKLEEATADYPHFRWGSIINDAFDAIIDKHREGNEVVAMTGLENSPSRIFDLKPLWLKNVANLLWAKGGSSKAYFALLSCVMIDRGIKTMGLTARPGRALYLDWEEEEDIFRHRLLSVQKGLGIDDPFNSGILWKKMRGGLSNNIEEISRLVVDNDITFVVVDSVGPALGGSANDQEIVNRYFDDLGLLGITTLSIDHANKQGERTGTYEIFGSVYKYNRARQVYELRKVTQEDAEEFEAIFYHKKTNDLGVTSPTGFNVQFISQEVYNNSEGEYEKLLDMVKFDSLGIADADIEHLKGMSFRQLCYELVKDADAKGRDITVEDLAGKVAFIKNNSEGSVSIDVIERTLDNSKTMQVNNGRVQLIKSEEEAEWTA